MPEIRHNLIIKTNTEKFMKLLLLRKGLANWWAKQTIAKPEVGFVNILTFGKLRNEMVVTILNPNKKVEWKCINSIEEWIDTNILFDLEEKEGHTLLRFTHSGWRAVTDTFAGCNYDWGRFMTSLKLFCETGTGTPS